VDRKGRAQEKALCTEKAVQVLQVPYVQAGGQGAKRTWQDLYYLSKVPGAVCETQLIRQYIPVHKSMEKRNVWIYNCQ
jgi:hypothetical protein